MTGPSSIIDPVPLRGAYQGVLPRDRPRVLAHLERDGRLHAVTARDPSYSLLLTHPAAAMPRGTSGHSAAKSRSHREYDMLDSGGPTQNALAEFAGDQREGRPRRRPTPPAPNHGLSPLSERLRVTTSQRCGTSATCWRVPRLLIESGLHRSRSLRTKCAELLEAADVARCVR